MTGSSHLKAYRDSLTDEQKEALLAQARVARTQKAADREASKHLLKLDYLDKSHWVMLASKYKLRMPNEADKASVSVIRKCLKKLVVDVQVWNDSLGTAQDWVKNNPKWTAYSAAGLCLELKEQQGMS